MTPSSGDTSRGVGLAPVPDGQRTPERSLSELYRQPEPGLADHARVVLDHAGQVAWLTFASVLLAAAYVCAATPTYRSDAVVQVEDKTKGVAGLDELSSVFSEKNLAETEIEIIRTRTLLGTVIDQLNLTIEAAPRIFPLVGGAIFRAHQGGLAAPPLGLTRYAWGGERIRLQRMDVPDDLLGKRLRLVADAGHRFRLVGPAGNLLLAGEVGKHAGAGDPAARFDLFVAELVARPGTEFDVMRRERDDVVREIQTTVRIEEKGKKTGVLTITLDGTDAQRVAAIVDRMAQLYQRQTAERKSTEAATSLEFIQEQLPLLRTNLDVAEEKLKSYQLKNGTVDLSLEAQALLDRASALEESVSALELSRSDLRARFTRSHPLLHSIREKTHQLKTERAAVEEKMQGLPEHEATQARLTRDVKVATELYFLLLNKSQELRVVKSGTIGNVRILDTAARPEQVGPRKRMIMLAALLFGFVLGIGLVLSKDALTQGVEDPDEIERSAGVTVYASVPHSAREAALAQEQRAGLRSAALAAHDPSDLAVESLRSLRTGLQFALADAHRKVIAVGSPRPGVGKSFVFVNLAHVFAQAGERVLLVDGDLRRGRIHRCLAVDRRPGLSEFLSGQCSLAEATRSIGTENLRLVPTGKLPPNPAELLAGDRFRAFVAEVADAYDVVLVDAPPILAVTDAALIARHATVNLLVVRAKLHTMREISQALKGPAWGGVRVHGIVLNDVITDRAGAGKYSYRYEYRTDRGDS